MAGNLRRFLSLAQPPKDTQNTEKAPFFRVGHPKYFLSWDFFFSLSFGKNFTLAHIKKKRTTRRTRLRADGRAGARAREREGKCSVVGTRKRPRRTTPLLFSLLRRRKSTTTLWLLTNPPTPPQSRRMGTRGARRRRRQRRHQRRSRERIKTMEEMRRFRAIKTTTAVINRSNRCSSTRKTL